jgi:hypothetical protein
MAARIIARLMLSISLTAIVAANRLGFDTDGSGDLQRDPLGERSLLDRDALGEVAGLVG